MSVKHNVDGRLKRLGVGIRTVIERADLFLEALAGATEVDRSHISRIERGKRNVIFLNVCHIADALG